MDAFQTSPLSDNRLLGSGGMSFTVGESRKHFGHSLSTSWMLQAAGTYDRHSAG